MVIKINEKQKHPKLDGACENQRTNSLYQVTLINIGFWGTPSVSGLGVNFEIPGICCF